VRGDHAAVDIVTRSLYRSLIAGPGRLASVLTLAVLAVLVGPAPPADAATITVTNANDTLEGSGNPITGDGVSLREAILSVNGGASINADVVPSGIYGSNDTIAFNIPTGSTGCDADTGVCTIAVSSGGLPTISKTVTIDGYTQPGASPNTLAVGKDMKLKIEIHGGSAGTGVNGLVIDAPSTTVRGLVIRMFNQAAGILVQQAGGGSAITGHYLGPDPTGGTSGQSTDGSSWYGLAIEDAPGVSVGGTAVEAGNVVSANRHIGITVTGTAAAGTTIQGNIIGLTADGTEELWNNVHGIHIIGMPNITIGGTVLGARNIISGNLGHGIHASGLYVKIQGNYVGLNAAGTARRGNFANGINITAAGATIGGSTEGARNVVSGNQHDGINISFFDTPILNDPANTPRILGNYVGTDSSGESIISNGGNGVIVVAVAGAITGGTDPAESQCDIGKHARWHSHERVCRHRPRRYQDPR
jgi:hypothetical protein